ncbi:MAG: hypothetical protein J7M29_11980 [Verrucomicrobia bacterium]|nr:hypothetical protein [Verrucomicrobiota bacterium]
MWEKKDSGGGAVVWTNRYVELAEGLNRWDELRQQWVPARPCFEETSQGYFLARQTQVQAILPPDLTQEPVDVLGPDGARWMARPLGVGVADLRRGEARVLGELRPARPVQAASNVVVYPDCFEGWKADVVYEIRRGGLEQYVVLREGLPPLEALGMDPEQARVQVYNEVIQRPEAIQARRRILKAAPASLRQARVWDPDLEDAELVLGPATRIGMGQAFGMGKGGVERTEAAPVGKQWEQIGGMELLIESMDYPDLEAAWKRLPPLSPSRWGRAEPRDRLRRPPPSGGGKKEWAQVSFPERMQRLSRKTAAWRPPEGGCSYWREAAPAIAMDYEISSSVTDFTFQSDTTYYVSGTTRLYGTTRWEGGAVVKFAPDPESLILYAKGPQRWETDAYRPVIFTARDDDTVGARISESTGIPSGYYAWAAYYIQMPGEAVQVRNAQVRYAKFALATYNSYEDSFWHVQAADCGGAFYANAPATRPVRVENALCVGLSNYVFRSYHADWQGEHLTAEGASDLFQNAAYSSLTLRNSLLVGIENLGSYSDGGGNFVFSDGGGIWEPAVSGGYYLPAGSQLRDQGVQTIDADLWAELQQRTTAGPELLGGALTNRWVLNPRGLGDAGRPDVGYHYPIVDYAVSNLVLQADLTLTNGVAVGFAGQYGLWLQDGGGVQSAGAPQGPNRIVNAPAVSELPQSGKPSTFITIYGTSEPVSVRMRFTEATLWGAYFLYNYGLPVDLELRDCVVCNGSAWLYLNSGRNMSVKLINNVLERGSWWFSHAEGDGLELEIGNNLFRGGYLTFDYAVGSSNPIWTAQDNLFDETQIMPFSSGWEPYLTCSHNGFTAGTENPLGGGNNQTDLVPDFVPGPLGPYYYPAGGDAGSLANLIGAGSRPAPQAGLYHYTVREDLVPEGTGTVSIGFHYVATDAAGVPLDADADGLPDYQEDRNGNGQYDPDQGETDWQTPEPGSTTAWLEVWSPAE